MKKIGLVDYYLSEWHANNYPKWIREACERLGFDYEVAYAWGEKDISPVDGVSSEEWCEKNGVTLCKTIDELCEKSDMIMILAPSDPQTHLGYAKSVLPYGKRTYIDKTFAPDLQTAKEIFALSEKYGTPFFSTSALRYASELELFKDGDEYFITGCGSNFEEYIIHIVEMAVLLLDDSAKKVMTECVGKNRICRVKTESGKSAMLVYSEDLPYLVTADKDGESISKKIKSDFFPVLIEEILKFFESGKLPFDPRQTLEVMRIRDALISSQKTPDVWVDVAK